MNDDEIKIDIPMKKPPADVVGEVELEPQEMITDDSTSTNHS